MQKSVLIALAIVGTLTAGYVIYRHNQPTKPTTELRKIYNQWKVDQRVSVGASEDEFRFKTFSNMYELIQKHNSAPKRTFDMGLNAFSHLTHEEFAATHLGLTVPKKTGSVTVFNKTTLQAKADWTGKLNAIKNQGGCGSCWAFSAVGALEGVHSIQKSNLLDLAEQELVDCSRSYGNMGCGGGWMDWAFQYVVDNKGISLTSEYPYKAVDGTCAAKSKQATITGFTDVVAGSPDALKAAIAQQPVSVAIDAGSAAFQGYKSGVITASQCGTALNHGVVAVGFDAEASIPFYNVRNSWGSGWGDKGHVKLGIEGGKGVCGIQSVSSFPTI